VNRRACVAVYLAALWWGSLTGLGFAVVPLLFRYLPTPAQAGQLAARLFSAQTALSLACGLVLLLLAPRSLQLATARPRDARAWILAGLLVALLSEFAVAPRIVARDQLALWHSVGSALYVLQWLCAGVVLWRSVKPRNRS